jgi:hypothetical protein
MKSPLSLIRKSVIDLTVKKLPKAIVFLKFKGMLK